MSATPDSTFTNPEQLIADLQRQLVECRAELDKAQRNLNETATERDDALARETATAEVLQVINSSPGDLAPVFDAILEKAHTLCDAKFGSLFFYDGEHFRAIASHGVPEALASRLREGIGANDSQSIQQLIAGAPFAHIHDSALEERAVYRGMDMVSRRRTLLSVPLRKGDVLLGMIVAGRLEVRPFNDKQIALLQNFASQAMIAMENARLLTETREALEQQTATAEVLQVINSSPGDLAPVFDAILEKAHGLCGTALGALLLYDGGKFRSVAQRGLSDPLAELLRQPFEPPLGSPPSRLLGGEPIVQITDMAEWATQHPDGARAQVGAEYGVGTVLFVPLRKDGVLLGHITAGRREVRPFSDEQIALLENFAAQAVIAMENARLITATREALEQQTATTEVLQVINSSPGQLAPVFDSILDKAHALCGAERGLLLTWDGEQLHRAAFRGVPDELIAAIGHAQEPVPGGFADRLVRGEGVIAVADLLEAAEKPIGPVAQVLVRFGARSCVGVALRRDEALLGAIVIYRIEVLPFSDKQIALLQNFAAQAMIAMENARLLTETQ